MINRALAARIFPFPVGGRETHRKRDDDHAINR